MKKIITFIGIIFIFLANIYSQNYISFTNEDNVTDAVMQDPPQRDVVQNAGSVDVTYNIPGATVQTVDENNTSYSLLKVKGFGVNNSEGNPTLPNYQDIFAVPQTSNLSVSVLSSTYRDYPNYTIYPSQGPAIDIDTVIPFKINRATYQSNSFYPGPLVEIKGTQDYKGIPLAFVQVNPVQYNPATNTIRCYSRIKYRLTHNNGNFYQSISSLDSKLLHNIVTNREFLLNKASVNNSSSKNYIIVTTNKFLPAVEWFAAWKRLTGFKTKILVQDTWTSAQVKKSVQNEYYASDVRPDYLLIVGDNEDVPGEFLETGYKDHYSDLYYVCMGGPDDYIPDMAKGRIPVSTVDEANLVFDKIMNYQSNPPSDNSFYQNGVNCAYFQAKFDNITAERRFTKTSEEIRDYMISQGYNINRIYFTEDRVSPQYYNNDIFANGEPVPEELRRSSNFNWNGNNIDIRNSINEGRFYVYHRDHGGYTAWAEPNFTVSDISQLANGDKLPVVFSMNCETGAFNLPICFSEKFLRQPNGGAVGVVCASETSMSGNNDALSIGLFDAIWSEPGLAVRFGTQGIVNPVLNEHADIYPMGDVLNQGLLRMTQTWSDVGWGFEKYTYELYHYFGDPSMEMYTAIPNTFMSVSVAQNGTSVTVNTGNVPDCKIVLCSKEDNGESYFSVVENTMVHTFTNVDVPCSICVMKHNYIPYFFNENVYIQNKTLTGKNVFVGKNIKVGKSVTPNKTQGDVTISEGAEVILDAENNVLLDAGFKCEKGGTLKIMK